MFAEDLRAAGWIYKANGFWCHPARSGECSEDIAIELLETIRSRDVLNETLKQQRWRDGEAGVSYVVVSDPPFLFASPRVDKFSDLLGALEAIFEELKDKPREAGTLIFSLVRKKYDKVTFPDGTECVITESYINTLFKWDGEKWENVFGNIQKLKGMG
jgi:hypothetical protein